MKTRRGPGGIECLELSHESGATALVALHGGHLVSWKTPEEGEQLFLSERSSFDAGKAIRGGVPIIFPQFSDRGPFSRHGFARRTRWSISAKGDAATDLLRLESSPETIAEWPHPFRLRFGVDLGLDTISLNFTVENTGGEPFFFDVALHTYLRVDGAAGAAGASVHGLRGRSFQNELTGQVEVDSGEKIALGEETDRVYAGAGDASVELRDGRRNLTLSAEGFPDLVVWNIGPGHGLADLPEEGWREYFCVEAARIQSPVAVDPGKSWTGSQHIAAASRE